MILTASGWEAQLPGITAVSLPHDSDFRPRMWSCRYSVGPSEQMELGTLTPSCPQQHSHYCHLLIAVVNSQSQLNYFRAKHTVFVKYFSLINL